MVLDKLKHHLQAPYAVQPPTRIYSGRGLTVNHSTRNVFVSHIHEDDAGLGKFKTLLKSNGMTVRDYSINSDNPNNAHSESYIKSQILAPRIRQCSVVAVYVSPKTKNSKYVNWEIEYAHKKGKRIVGVWAHGEKGCEPPEALIKYGDAFAGWRGNSIVDAINGDNNDWQEPDGSPGSYQAIKRYSC